MGKGENMFNLVENRLISFGWDKIKILDKSNAIYSGSQRSTFESNTSAPFNENNWRQTTITENGNRIINR